MGGTAVTITPDTPPAPAAPVTITPDAPAQAASTPAAPQWPLTQNEGESYADFMKRTVEAGRYMQAHPEQYPKTSTKDLLEGLGEVGAVSILGPPLLMLAGTGLPEELVGSGIAGAAASGATAGAASELTKKGLQAVGGENVFTPKSAEDIGESALTGGIAGYTLGLFGNVANKLLTSKLSRGMINESLGAISRDVTYGNPAKAILDEGITSPITGDIEKYKDALRAGQSADQAMIAAGGRAGAVQKVINDISPQLDQTLSKSTVPINVSDIIDRPLMESASSIMDNRAMTQAEKDAALNQLGALQQSLKEGLPDTVTPLQANKIKQAIGQRVNWAGNIAVTDEVKPAYRAVYGAIKNAVNDAVPEAAGLNERLTNLLTAQTDLEKLMKAEEVGQGKGALGSAVTGIARRAEAVAGRGIPVAAKASNVFAPRVAPVVGASTPFWNMRLNNQ